MKKFGETIRTLRTAQDIGLREMASKINISPTYLSRIERGKELPPSAEIIKAMAKLLAADPDVLFRIASKTDPEVLNVLNSNIQLMELIRNIIEKSLNDSEIASLISYIDHTYTSAKTS